MYKRIQVIVDPFKKIFFKKKKKKNIYSKVASTVWSLNFIFWQCQQNQKYNILYALNIDNLVSFED